MNLRILTIIFCILLSAEIALATGITATNLNAKIRFEPNMQYGFSYTLVAEDYDNSYTLEARGDLSEYVKFENRRLENIPANSRVPFTGIVNLPEAIRPGWHRLEICVTEDCRGGAMMCGRTGVCGLINFQALHQGIKPILRSFNGHNVNEGEPVTFTATIENQGLDTIKNVAGTINILSASDELVGSTDFNPIEINGGETKDIRTTFDTDGLLPAKYTAKADIKADNYTLSGETNFNIGFLSVDIVDYTKEIEVGGIKRFLTTIESGWNDPIPVYVDVRIYNSSDGVTARSATITLKPWEKTTIESYIDLSDFEEGEYDLEVKLHFAENTEVANDKINLIADGGSSKEEIGVEAVKETAQASSIMIITIILIVLVVLLTLINVFLVLKRKNNK